MGKGELEEEKTGVINDPLGQPTDPADSDCCLILRFRDGRYRRTYERTERRTDNLFENSDHYHPGLWSAMWIKKLEEKSCRLVEQIIDIPSASSKLTSSSNQLENKD